MQMQVPENSGTFTEENYDEYDESNDGDMDYKKCDYNVLTPYNWPILKDSAYPASIYQE